MNIVPFDLKKRLLTPKYAQEEIRKRAQDTDAVILSGHVHVRMSERDVLRRELFRILREGRVSDKPVETIRGDIEAKICLKLRGTRSACVATIILLQGKEEGKVFIKTVMFEGEY